MTAILKRRIVCIGYKPDNRPLTHDNAGKYVCQQYDGQNWDDITSCYDTRDEVYDELG